MMEIFITPPLIEFHIWTKDRNTRKHLEITTNNILTNHNLLI